MALPLICFQSADLTRRCIDLFSFERRKLCYWSSECIKRIKINLAFTRPGKQKYIFRKHQAWSNNTEHHPTSLNIIEHHQHHRTHFLLHHHHHHHHIAKQRTKTQKPMWTIGNLSKRPAISHCHLPGATTAAPGGTAVAKRVPGTAGTGSSTCEGEFGAVEFGSIYTDSLWFTHTMKNDEKCRFDMTWL